MQSSNYSQHVDDPCGFVGDEVNVTAEEIFKPPCSSGPQAEQAWGSRLVVPDVSQTCDSCQASPLVDTVYTLHGTGNNARCRQLVDDLFPEAECGYPSCSFNGVYQPPVESAKFLVRSKSSFYCRPYLSQ